ncbi:MAG: imidazole glycerol phosphate synthase subunit HisH [Clostridia bacterium]|nr:imidazole glycerol phosphate synthase subunit HisH [Clostridia bacterium]
MIAIIDYDAGNLKSVSKALERLGFDAVITSSEKEISNSKAMILPGVGAFGDCMNSLKDKGLDQCIIKNVQEGKYLLGICLGMQMLFEESYEDGVWDGLGLLEGDVVRFNADLDLKIPHMGWNNLIANGTDTIGKNIEAGEFVYFVHSYYAQPKNDEDVVFYTEYDVKVPAVVRKNNVIGMQFHPEKSGQTGMQLLKNFGELIK